LRHVSCSFAPLCCVPWLPRQCSLFCAPAHADRANCRGNAKRPGLDPIEQVWGNVKRGELANLCPAVAPRTSHGQNSSYRSACRFVFAILASMLAAALAIRGWRQYLDRGPPRARAEGRRRAVEQAPEGE